MTPICRACGRVKTDPTPRLLRMMGVDRLPEYLGGLCLSCLYEVDNRREVLPDDSDFVPISPAALHAYLTLQVRDIADRVSRGRPVIYCEGIGNTWPDEVDLPCRRWASRFRDGHNFCHWCDKAFVRDPGRLYSGPRQAARSVLIWARDADELLRKAHEAAALFRGDDKIIEGAAA